MRCANVASGVLMHRHPVTTSSSVQLFAALLFLFAATDRVAADTGIGTAVAITTNVTGAAAATDAIILKAGDSVFQNEVIVTDAKGIGQFEFSDKTRLAIGPGSTVVLDNFVYNSASSKAKAVINL